jgi:transcriptional regulator with XRE-family HTH domain
MSGKDLKLRRVDADVKVKDLAAAMGVTDSRISRIENSRTVTPDAITRYLTALSTCTTKSTGTQDAA